MLVHDLSSGRIPFDVHIRLADMDQDSGAKQAGKSLIADSCRKISRPLFAIVLVSGGPWVYAISLLCIILNHQSLWGYQHDQSPWDLSTETMTVVLFQGSR